MDAQGRLDFYNRFMEAFSEALAGRRILELSDDELYVLQDFLWAATDDVVSEWARREMRKRSPFPPVERETL
jgi:hypothetical protein